MKKINFIVGGWMAIMFLSLTSPVFAFSFNSCKKGCDAALSHCQNAAPYENCNQHYSVCINRCVSEGIRRPQYSANELKTYYGAIAFDAKTGSWGYSLDNDSALEAEEAALSGCKKNGAECTVIVPLTNQCGAIVSTSAGAYSYSTANTKKAAEKRAMASCEKNENEGCEVRVSVCTRK